MEVLKISFNDSVYQDDTDFVYAPIADNMDRLDCYKRKELLKQIPKLFYSRPDELKVEIVDVDIKNPDDMVLCAENTDLWIYSESAYKVEVYHRPFDENPDTLMFAGKYSWHCYEGIIYSKDFGFFFCDICMRTICRQNPSNGWHVQYHELDEWYEVCLKCYQEKLFKEGVDIDEVLRVKELPGMFFTESELEEKGFILHPKFDGFLVGHGMRGYKNPSDFFEALEGCRDALQDCIVIISYDHMAIGGMGGYVSVWYKPKNEKK